MGNGLAVSVQLLILSTFGYNAALSIQPDSAVRAIAVSYILIPLICEIVAFIAISFYRIEGMRDQIQSDLIKRRGRIEIKED